MSKTGKRRKGRKKSHGKRLIGFHCTWCLRKSPYNERFVPNYYRPPEGRGRDPHMCYACWLEGAGRNGKRQHPTKIRPRLSPETLEQFWREDTADGDPIEVAASYFRVSCDKVREAKAGIEL